MNSSMDIWLAAMSPKKSHQETRSSATMLQLPVATGGQSPTLYATDQASYLVQGWIVTDADILAMFDLAEDETLVEICPQLMTHLAKDGLGGEVTQEVYPIVHVRENGRYILRGKRVTDTKALAQMSIPDHETAIEIPKGIMAELVKGH